MGQFDLDDFINSLIDKKNLTGLPDEDRAEVVNELKGLLTQQINRAILEKLPDQQLDKLNNLMDSDAYTTEEMQKIIAESGIDVSKIVAETMLYFEAFYLGGE